MTKTLAKKKKKKKKRKDNKITRMIFPCDEKHEASIIFA